MMPSIHHILSSILPSFLMIQSSAFRPYCHRGISFRAGSLLPKFRSTPQNENADSVQSLLDGVLRRVDRTMTSKENSPYDVVETVRSEVKSRGRGGDPSTFDKDSVKRAVADALGSAVERANESLEKRQNEDDNKLPASNPAIRDRSESKSRDISKTQGGQDDSLTATTAVVTAEDVARSYGSNPTITSTALAHSLWKYVIRPNVDTVIDATAGNGGDSVELAQILFTQPTGVSTRSASERKTSSAFLLAVDIQQEACQNTLQALESVLPPETISKNVQVLQATHAPLPLPKDVSSVALVVYNLGFLPNSSKDAMTQTESTIASLADAALLLRVGGMLSVMTYPKTNKEEDMATRAFVEGLALFSSVTLNYRDYLDSLDDICENVRERLLITLQHVLEQGGTHQTWRVHEHKQLGRVDAPILYTATRIK